MTKFFKHFLQGRTTVDILSSFYFSSYFFIFYFSEISMLISSLCLKYNFTGFWVLGWWIFSFNSFKYFTLFYSCFHGFWREVWCNSYGWSSEGNVFLPSSSAPGFFQDLFVLFLFFSWNMMAWVWYWLISRIFPVWYSLSFQDLWFAVINFKVFPASITKNIYFAPLFLLLLVSLLYKCHTFCDCLIVLRYFDPFFSPHSLFLFVY